VPERPLLRLPDPSPAGREKRKSQFPAAPPGLSPGRQRERSGVGPRFDRLRDLLAGPGGARLQETDEDVAPERAVVFDVSRDVDGFLRAATAIGLEYLTEEDSESPADEGLEEGGRLYMVMPSLEGLVEILRLWDLWQAGEELGRGLTPWRDVFSYLREVRRWGPQDRLQHPTREYIEEMLEIDPDGIVRLELELFFRMKPQQREAGLRALTRTISGLGGRLVSRVVIEDIRYEGALVEVSAHGARHLLEQPGADLAGISEVMYVCPQAMASVVGVGEPEGGRVGEPVGELLPPIAALFDGVPMQGHDRLAGRLELDDPDGFEGQTVVGAREHGTQMASLILHGDLNRHGTPLRRKLYVRPVMKAVSTASGHTEEFPGDRLVVDLIHESVIRICDPTSVAHTPEIFIVNLSLGDRNRPYAGRPSAWAKLLDFLANKYGLLVMVAAGNIMEPISLSGFPTVTAFEAATEQDRLRAIVDAWSSSRASRSLLAPAEALNVVTVGAWHEDATTTALQAAMALDPFPANDLPNLSSGLGHGHRRSIKPDIYMEGGREPVRYSTSAGEVIVDPMVQSANMGLLAAAPGVTLTGTRLLRGTSAATALGTRAATQIHDLITDHAEDGPLVGLPREYKAVVTKALLIHGARWDPHPVLFDLIPLQTQRNEQQKQHVAQLLGYGRTDVSKAFECLAERATLVGYGDIGQDQAAVYELPLPPSLSGSVAARAVTFTVAWLSPINVRHRAYRAAHLSIRRVDEDLNLAVDRAREQPSHHAVQRGTVFHERYEGDSAAGFVDGATFRFQVECRTQAGDLAEPVRFGIAVSLEVEVGAGIDVYTEVKSRLQVRPRSQT